VENGKKRRGGGAPDLPGSKKERVSLHPRRKGIKASKGGEGGLGGNSWIILCPGGEKVGGIQA